MTSQQIFAAIDGFISAFMTFCRSVLGPIAILCAFFAGIKSILTVLPMLNTFIPSVLIRGDVLPLAATAIACSLAGRSV